MLLRLASISVFASLLLLGSFKGWAQKPELAIQTGHQDIVTSISFSPKGKILASSARQNPAQIKLWHVESGKELRTIIAHSGYINSLAFKSDGKTLASSS